MSPTPRVRQGDTPYSVTQETSDEGTGKVSQQPDEVSYHYDLDTTPSGNAKPSGTTTSYFDESLRPKSKAVTSDTAENKAVARKRTRSK